MRSAEQMQSPLATAATLYGVIFAESPSYVFQILVPSAEIFADMVNGKWLVSVQAVEGGGKQREAFVRGRYPTTPKIPEPIAQREAVQGQFSY